MAYEIRLYAKENGRVPVFEFMDGLRPSLRAKMVRDLQVLEEKGPRLYEPYAKHMGEGLYELRIKQSGDIARVFYFFYCDGTIVVTNGFVKKSNKTLPREIERARRYKRDWEARYAQ